MLLVIDNYDSFTYNIVQYLSELGADVEIVQNDAVSIEDIKSMPVDRILLSPGPRTPREAGISIAVVEHFGGRVPILGVCLGHQCIGFVHGARVVKAKRLMHGKTSVIHHCGDGVFYGLKNPFVATRYHSLVLDAESLAEEFTVSAWTENEQGQLDEVMGISHSQAIVDGVQFHPESIMSEQGHALLQNFLSRNYKNQ